MSGTDNPPTAPDKMPPHEVPKERQEEQKQPPDTGDGQQVDDNQDDLGRPVKAEDQSD